MFFFVFDLRGAFVWSFLSAPMMQMELWEMIITQSALRVVFNIMYIIKSCIKLIL